MSILGAVPSHSKFLQKQHRILSCPLLVILLRRYPDHPKHSRRVRRELPHPSLCSRDNHHPSPGTDEVMGRSFLERTILEQTLVDFGECFGGHVFGQLLDCVPVRHFQYLRDSYANDFSKTFSTMDSAFTDLHARAAFQGRAHVLSGPDKEEPAGAYGQPMHHHPRRS